MFIYTQLKSEIFQKRIDLVIKYRKLSFFFVNILYIIYGLRRFMYSFNFD